MRIGIAGFQHETNTFAPSRAGFEEFTKADSWPELLEGKEVLSKTVGLNLPIAGAASVAQQEKVELVPVLWCAAEPSGFVTDDAFDLISGKILAGFQTALPLDAVYLDLHGAMVTETYQDGEGELLRRLRHQLGDIPIGVSLDLHANVSTAMVESASLITIYRTYPHLDMADTGERCMQHLIALLRSKNARLQSAFKQAPFLIPLHAQYTGAAPCRELYQRLDILATQKNEWLELALGFTAADIHDCGPSVIAYADSEERAATLADQLMQELIDEQAHFDIALRQPAEALLIATQSAEAKPMVLADVQDNPGAGGTSDTTGLLQAAIDLNASGVVLGVMCDADVASMAHDVGIGRSFKASLGAKSGLPNHSPVLSEFEVLALSEGDIRYTGEMYGGGIATLGRSCMLATGNSKVKIVVSSNRIQCLDQALFRHFGVVLEEERIICVKSTVHHRADFQPIASSVINVAAPGIFNCDLNQSDYRYLRSDVSIL